MLFVLALLAAQTPVPASAADPIVCRDAMPTGGHIAKRICRPQSAWVRDQQAERARRALGRDGALVH